MNKIQDNFILAKKSINVNFILMGCFLVYVFLFGFSLFCEIMENLYLFGTFINLINNNSNNNNDIEHNTLIFLSTIIYLRVLYISSTLLLFFMESSLVNIFFNFLKFYLFHCIYTSNDCVVDIKKRVSQINIFAKVLDICYFSKYGMKKINEIANNGAKKLFLSFNDVVFVSSNTVHQYGTAILDKYKINERMRPITNVCKKLYSKIKENETVIKFASYNFSITDNVLPEIEKDVETDSKNNLWKETLKEEFNELGANLDNVVKNNQDLSNPKMNH